MIIQNLQVLHQENEKGIVEESLHLMVLHAMELTDTEILSTYPATTQVWRQQIF